VKYSEKISTIILKLLQH